MPEASEPQKRCFACAFRSRKKQLFVDRVVRFTLNTNTALYRIKVNAVALVLGTYSQIARHRLCFAFGFAVVNKNNMFIL